LVTEQAIHLVPRFLVSNFTRPQSMNKKTHSRKFNARPSTPAAEFVGLQQGLISHPPAKPMKSRSRFCSIKTLAAVVAAMIFVWTGSGRAQTSVTLDGTSGSNTISTSYTTTGGLTLGMGFFVDYLIVGGGGGGGGHIGGGGGGGAVQTNVGQTLLQLTSTNSTITVGSGGAGGSNNSRGATGGPSSALGLTAAGGGGGGAYNAVEGNTASQQNGSSGASGGGGAPYNNNSLAGSGGSATAGNAGGSGQNSASGFRGGGGGGVGGAGTSGSSSTVGNGGSGVASTITGASGNYAAGGGGGVTTGSSGTGGSSVGGNGGSGSSAQNGTAGSASTGSGGGGGGFVVNASTGGSGASGVVMIRYAGNSTGVTGGTAVAGTGSASGSTIQQFTSSGTFGVDLNSRLGATLSNGISGSGNFTYNGPGLLTLAADSSYSGSTTISAGTLRIGAGGTAGSLGSGAVTNNGTLVFNRSDSLTTTSAISGNGSLLQAGTGTTILSANNTYTGGTVVSAGSLVGTTASLQGSITNNAAVTFNQSTLGTYSGVMSGSGSLSKTGIGRLSLSGSSSYNGATAVSAGDLNLSGGSIASSAVTVASGASLSGYGSVGTIGGAGAINPGNSPGILTTPEVNPSGGTSFNFEMTGTAPTYSNAASSVNDLIQITGMLPATPFSEALTADNGINIYFSGDALFTGSTAVQYKGGFFTDQSASFASSISGATYNYYFANASGTNSYNGANYYSKAQYESLVLLTNMSITVTTVAQTADFASGVASGQIMQVQVIPEPSTYVLLLLAGAGLLILKRRKVAL
jgi:autotransporter-associated beta strand protein